MYKLGQVQIATLGSFSPGCELLQDFMCSKVFLWFGKIFIHYNVHFDG